MRILQLLKWQYYDADGWMELEAESDFKLSSRLLTHFHTHFNLLH